MLLLSEVVWLHETCRVTVPVPQLESTLETTTGPRPTGRDPIAGATRLALPRRRDVGVRARVDEPFMAVAPPHEVGR